MTKLTKNCCEPPPREICDIPDGERWGNSTQACDHRWNVLSPMRYNLYLSAAFIRTNIFFANFAWVNRYLKSQKDNLYFFTRGTILPLALLISLCKTSSIVVVCSKGEVWWLISALNAVHLALLPAQLCPLLQLWVTNLQTWGCQQESPWWGGVQTHRQASIHIHAQTHRETLAVYFSHCHTHVHNLSALLSFCPSLFLSLSHTYAHTTLLPQESDLFIELLCVGVGGGMAVLFHPAQTGSQINILSPAGQLVQAGQTAPENLSLWFHVCRLS